MNEERMSLPEAINLIKGAGAEDFEIEVKVQVESWLDHPEVVFRIWETVTAHYYDGKTLKEAVDKCTNGFKAGYSSEATELMDAAQDLRGGEGTVIDAEYGEEDRPKDLLKKYVAGTRLGGEPGDILNGVCVEQTETYLLIEDENGERMKLEPDAVIRPLSALFGAAREHAIKMGVEDEIEEPPPAPLRMEIESIGGDTRPVKDLTVRNIERVGDVEIGSVGFEEDIPL